MLSSKMDNAKKDRANSVVSGVMEDEAQRISSPSVLVPSTTDTTTTKTKLIGKDTRRVIFPCEDVREKKKKKIEALKENFLFFCTTSILKGMFPLKKTSTEIQPNPTQENKVGMFLVYNLYKLLLLSMNHNSCSSVSYFVMGGKLLMRE